MKHLLNSRYQSGTTDPNAALARDVALTGGTTTPQGNQTDQLGATLEALITRQRYMKSHMAKVMKNAELRHQMVCISSKHLGYIYIFMLKIKSKLSSTFIH